MMDRREFMHTATVGGAGLAASFAGLPIVAGPFDRQEGVDHFVPEDKRLTRQWVRALSERGESTWYSGENLQTIGMPVGGICAGQMYLTGDGRLACWDIFNQNQSTGAGAVNYAVGRAPEQTVQGGKVVPASSVAQGFAIRIRGPGATVQRTLDREGFPGVRFCGEYPLGRVRYEDESVPVEVELLAFSPFIPLNADDSALPATVLRYSVRNTSSETLEVEIAGWLENVIGLHTSHLFGERMLRRNQLLGSDLLTGVLATAEEAPLEDAEPERDPIVFATFEGEDYGDWRVEGTAFGSGPVGGTLKDQNPVSGYEGEKLVNTYLGGDAPFGRLISPTFTIERPWISFLVGGGSHEGRTCVNLVVEERVVRSAAGLNRERLQPHNWNVEELLGRRARLEIVDEESGGWGHINVDQIEFRDGPRNIDPGRLQDWPDVGSLCLAVVGEGIGRTSVGDETPMDALFGSAGAVTGDRIPGTNTGPGDPGQDPAVRPTTEKLMGAVGTTLSLEPGAEGHVTFILSWFLPNMYREDTPVGNRYAVRFDGADGVSTYLAHNLHSLMDRTLLWHRTYYDSTLPHWLLDRIHSTVSTLASSTCQWWKNGRFWAWEGAGCCRGTCGHVWNYEHAMARLFPDLERSVREMQDFAPGVGLDPETGAIGFRGEDWTLWAGDAQGGYILKALREHQTSPDDGFLRRNWPNVKKAVEFLMREDGDADGILEGQQHQTYDENYFGANTMVGSLYLGALRAAEEMARELGEDAFARQCREIFEAGESRSVERLFNGEYFIQDVDLEEHPDWQYGDGCLADQLFGQGWAHQVGLGYLYPEDTVRTALRSIWRYCWAPDVGPQNDAHAPERWFALPGEAGLFTCTWPRSFHMGPRSTRYRNEIWTGIEYQVAGHMAREGMLTEALAICRGIHERYHPSKHNPWNEIECGDHYARALASWTMLTGLSGFRYHGPKRLLGFAPRITPENFRCPFTAAEGWGTFAQERSATEQTSEVSLTLGVVPLTSLELEVPAAAVVRTAEVTLNGSNLEALLHQASEHVTLVVPDGSIVGPGETLRVVLQW